MLGTIWINTGMGLLAFVVTFGTALASNVWLVSLERAGVAFVLFFLAAFPIRWVIAVVTQIPAAHLAVEEGAVAEGAEAPLAAHQEDTQTGGEEGSFSPLAVSNMERIHPAENPTTVAEVIRRLTDE